MSASPRAQFRALLRLASVKEVAEVFGVSMGTVRRYRARGTISKAFADRLPIALRGARERAKEEKRALKAKPEALAQIYGVTVITAKRWQKQGHVSARKRSVIGLLEAETRVPLPRRLRTAIKAWKETKLSVRGVSYTLELNAYNDEATRRVILEWAHGVRDPFLKSLPRKYNMSLIGNAPEAFSTRARLTGGGNADAEYTAYNTIQLRRAGWYLEPDEAPRDPPPNWSDDWKRGHFKQVVLGTFSHSVKKRVFADMINQLVAADTQGLFVEKVTLYIRVPKP